LARAPLNPHTCQLRIDSPNSGSERELCWCDNNWVGVGSVGATNETVGLHNTNTYGVAVCTITKTTTLADPNRIPCLELMQQMYDSDSQLPDWPPPDVWQVIG
jgi:hypothetical protein